MARVRFLSATTRAPDIQDPLVWSTSTSGTTLRLLVDPGTTGLTSDGILSSSLLRDLPQVGRKVTMSPVALRMPDGSISWTTEAMSVKCPFELTLVVADLNFGDGVHGLLGKAGMVRLMRDHSVVFNWL